MLWAALRRESSWAREAPGRVTPAPAAARRVPCSPHVRCVWGLRERERERRHNCLCLARRRPGAAAASTVFDLRAPKCPSTDPIAPKPAWPPACALLNSGCPRWARGAPSAAPVATVYDTSTCVIRRRGRWERSMGSIGLRQLTGDGTAGGVPRGRRPAHVPASAGQCVRCGWVGQRASICTGSRRRLGSRAAAPAPRGRARAPAVAPSAARRPARAPLPARRPAALPLARASAGGRARAGCGKRGVQLQRYGREAAGWGMEMHRKMYSPIGACHATDMIGQVSGHAAYVCASQ